ncbi:MAG: PAS domain S-box protein [Singulisphaera sp.]|nr:PAS domain S-box protein [Singulisphaera sp.]
MSAATTSIEHLLAENESLRGRLDEAEATLAAIRNGEVDALVVGGPQGDQIYTLSGADRSYRILVEEMHQGAATLDGDGVVLYCNRRLAEILRIPQAILSGASLYSFVTVASRPLFEALLRQGLTERCQGDVMLRAGDGTRVPVYLAVNPLPMDGRATVCVAITDLTEQKRREELVAAERLARSILDQAVDGIVVCNETGIVIRASRMARELCGRNPILQPFATSFPLRFSAGSTSGQSGAEGDDGQTVSLAGVLGGATLHSVEVCFRRRDGTQLDVLLSAGPLRDGRRRIIGCVVTLTDITERKQAAEALRQERDFAESLIETAQAIVVVLDTAGRIVRFNPYLGELAGYQQDEIRGKDWLTTFVPERDRPRRREILSQIMAGATIRDLVNPIVTKSGRERTISWSSKALKDATGRTIGVLAIGHDITELRAAQQRALQSERLAAIGEMVAGLAHESRNALNRGQVCLEMLALEVEDRPEALRLIARLQQAQDDLLTLYEDVRGYAAPIHLERRVCDLAEVWRAAWAHLAPLREGREAVLREEIEGLDPRCTVDPFRLEQVFRNTLENSLAACRDPVAIAIHGTEAEVDGRPALRVAVRDRGPGLGPEQKQRLFEPFYTTKTKGTGLGMAITKRIVEAHGGRIAVGEDGGPGAEIILILPRGNP